VADSSVVTGACLLLLGSFFEKKLNENPAAS
jgi:lipoprotein signal peptidase